MLSARVSAVAWLRCIASRSLVASVSACLALSPMAVACRSLIVKVLASRLMVAW
jgi:hypothetical protein